MDVINFAKFQLDRFRGFGAEHRYLSLTGGIALTTVYALRYYTVIIRNEYYYSAVRLKQVSDGDVESSGGKQFHARGPETSRDFPRVNLSTYGGQAFAYTGPTFWNSLPDNLKNVNLSLQTFKRRLKTFFFSSY